jgi:hypothetical protein
MRLERERFGVIDLEGVGGNGLFLKLRFGV